MEKLHCPYCKGELKITHQERYQDLSEHVSDPNGTPSMKDGYVCLNQACIAYETHTWISDGDYFTKRPKDIPYREWEAMRKDIAGTENFHAIGSWNYYYKIGEDAIKAKTFKINLYFYKFVFSPREKGWDYPEDQRHMPNMWKWKVEIWKKSSDYGYTSVIPFWRMTSYQLRVFKRSYKNWKETENKTSLEQAFCASHSLSEFGMVPDKRFYSRLASRIIQIFYPNRVKELNQSIKIK